MSEHKMTGAELQSMLKSNFAFTGLDGLEDEELKLSENDIKWWRDAKFGLFIHWGIYSAIGKGEWAYYNEGYTEEEYRKEAENFRPALSADEITDGWLKAAHNAGMKYAVMVTRHHDGFAMWNSKCSYHDFTSVKFPPHSDYVRAFTDSCRKFGIHTGLYYSPMDWRFPGYFDPNGEKESALEMKSQAYGQIRELLSDYGKVDILWYDGGWLAHSGSDADAAWLWEPIKLNKMARELQPKIMTTPRSGYRGDFQCSEGRGEIRGGIVPMPWEKCMSVSSAWGYIPNDGYMAPNEIIRIMSDAVCRDGNLLLNIAPDKDGRIPEEAEKTLSKTGEWLKRNGEAVYGTRGGPLEPVDGVYGTTRNENSVYIHVCDRDEFLKLSVPCLPRMKVSSAEMLNGEKIDFCASDGKMRFSLPDLNDTDADGNVFIIKLNIER